jgi:hypothetical protein
MTGKGWAVSGLSLFFYCKNVACRHVACYVSTKGKRKMEILKLWPIIAFLLVYGAMLIWFLATTKQELKSLKVLLGKDIEYIRATIDEMKKSLEDFVTRRDLEEKLKRLWDKIDEHSKEIAEIFATCKRNHMRGE